ncbi:MAG TPA: FtsH protease activity modulator HflK [Rhodanobacteraceae bacterium]
MPWKEPGEKPSEPRDREPHGREPWGSGQGGHGGGPDLDAWLKNLRRRLGPFGRGPIGVLALVVVLIVLWFVIGGWTSIGTQQVGVLLRFGRFERVLQPGFHLRFPSPIDQVQKVDMGRTRSVNDEARLLTRDGQLALVDYSVHYKVTNARDFLYSTQDSEEVLRDASTAAVRAVVGSHDLRCLVEALETTCPTGRIDDDKLAGEVLGQLKASLADMHAGLGVAITDVGIQDINVPSDVSQAFDGIAKAHEETAAAKTTAEADVERHKAEVKAQVASIKTDADAYRRQVIADANAAVARFNQVLPAYQAEPQVTRHQLWLNAMHDVLTRNHVVVNTGSGNVVVQFQLQRSAAAGQPASATSAAPAASSAAAPSASVALPVTSGPAVQASAQ